MNRTGRLLVRRSLLIVFVIAFLGTTLGLGYRYYLLRSAESLLADIKALRLGESDFADATNIARKYRRFRVEGSASVPASLDPAENIFPAGVCTPDRCFFEFVIDNRPLSTLHLVYGAHFTAAFAVLHGRVQYVEAHLMGGPYPGVSGAFVQEINSRDERASYTFPTPIGKPYLSVRLTPKASPFERDRAFAMNMRCLVASTNCNKPCDFLPRAWNDWKAAPDKAGEGDGLRSTYPNCP